jgi:predicted membrane metal-binding protein
MNLLECTKVNTFFEFTKQNDEIFKKKLFLSVNSRPSHRSTSVLHLLAVFGAHVSPSTGLGSGNFRFGIQTLVMRCSALFLVGA